MPAGKLERIIFLYFSGLGILMVSLSFGSFIFAYILAGAYFYYLYRIWDDKRIVFSTAVALGLSYFVLGIAFAFTFPVWIVFGLLCMLYGARAGFFKRQQQDGSILQRSSGTVARSGWSRPLIFLVGACAALSVVGYFAFYGFQYPPCTFRDKTAAVPSELVGSELVTRHDMYIGYGSRPTFCSPLLRSIDRHILSSVGPNDARLRSLEDRTDRAMGNPARGAYSREGLRVETVGKGKRFWVEGLVGQTAIGVVGAIGGRSGAMYYLILKDEQGEIYSVPTVYLNDENPWFAVQRDGGKAFDLGDGHFDHLE